jgi:hypothetical protein
MRRAHADASPIAAEAQPCGAPQRALDRRGGKANSFGNPHARDPENPGDPLDDARFWRNVS